MTDNFITTGNDTRAFKLKDLAARWEHSVVSREIIIPASKTHALKAVTRYKMFFVMIKQASFTAAAAARV